MKEGERRYSVQKIAKKILLGVGIVGGSLFYADQCNKTSESSRAYYDNFCGGTERPNCVVEQAGAVSGGGGIILYNRYVLKTPTPEGVNEVRPTLGKK